MRTARTVFFTAVCLLLSTAGHALAAGDAPASAAVVAGGGLVFLAAHRFAGRERSLAQLTGAVLSAQLGLHGLFSYVPAPAADGHQAMTQHAVPTMTLDMFAAHVVAGLLVAWWLRRGEALLWSAGHRLAAALPLGRALGLLRPDPAPAGPATVLPVPAGVRTPAITLLSHAVSRRGPPVLAF